MNIEKSPHKVIIAPKLEPVSIAEVKDQLGIQATDNVSDALILRRIRHARKKSEAYTGRAFIDQTREIRWDRFVDRHELPSALTIVSVKYVDSNGVEQTLSSDNYVLETYAFIPYVRLAYGVSWPSTRIEPSAVRIQFTAGYGSRATDVPEPLTEALILFVGHLMNNQPQLESGLIATRIPYAVRDMLDDFKLYFV